MEHNIKQIIVVRKDLNMRRGKLAAQASHASLGGVLQQLTKQVDDHGAMTIGGTFAADNVLSSWLNGSFTKVCVHVASEEELLAVVDAAKQHGLNVVLITDSGRTEFGGVPTNTCCAIGPDHADRLAPVTGHLPLY